MTLSELLSELDRIRESDPAFDVGPAVVLLVESEDSEPAELGIVGVESDDEWRKLEVHTEVVSAGETLSVGQFVARLKDLPIESGDYEVWAAVEARDLDDGWGVWWDTPVAGLALDQEDKRLGLAVVNGHSQNMRVQQNAEDVD